MSVVVVVPTYNERDNIESLARAVVDRPCAPRLLVVDDASPDGTAEIVTKLAEEMPDRVSLLSRAGKTGLGRAYAAGFAVALDDFNPDAVVQMDADGSHDPADIDRLVAGLEHAGLVIGSRYIPGGGTEGWSRGREALSRAGNLYARLLLGQPLHDLTGGFKAWRADVLRRLDPQSTASDGYGFQIEMTMRAHSVGAKIIEIPITFRERVAGSSKMSSKIAIEALRNVPSMRKYR